MSKVVVPSVMLVLVLALSACAQATPAAPTATPEPTPDIVDTAVAADDFNTLVTAVQAAGLVDALKGEGPFTVFAPTDAAFAALPDGTLDALLADTEALSQVLLYHVVPGQVMAADVTDGLEAETLQAEAVSFSVSDDGAMINDAIIVATDIEASNGVIHVIDAVILPPSMQAQAEAPTPDIVDTAIAADDFNTLVTAVQAAGLVDALKGEGPFTVFAPTDAAFAALPDGTLDSLLADTDALSQILLYHVVPGAVMAADVTDGLEPATLQGEAVSFSVSDDGVMINQANIVATDIAASNGVIHVIDAVILPPQID
jgi:transforming growth factor-beta-induced protein